MTLDVQKAAQIMREAGLAVSTGRSHAVGFDPASLDSVSALVGESLTRGCVDGSVHTADWMDALAARLVWTAALCRRIDAECRGTNAGAADTDRAGGAPERAENGVEASDGRVARSPAESSKSHAGCEARANTCTPMGPRGVVPGEPSTYPAEGEPLEDGR